MSRSEKQLDYDDLVDSHEVIIRTEMLAERLEALEAPPGSAVLEVGLGSGNVSAMLAQCFEAVTFADIDPARLQAVSNRIDTTACRAQFREVDAMKMGPALGSFNHIILMGLLEHCENGETVLARARDLLRPRGRVHVLVNNAHSIHRRLGVLIGDIEEVRELSPSDLRQGHKRVYTPNQLYAEVSRAGLHIDYRDQHYMKPLPTHMMDKLPLELSRAFVQLGRQFPFLAAYTYLEAVLP